MSLHKDKFKLMLKKNGIRVVGNKIHKEDFRKVFGAKYVEPEWLLLHEDKYVDPDASSENSSEWNSPPQQSDALKSSIDPVRYVSFIEAEEAKLNRVVLPLTYSIAKFGDFSLLKGKKGVAYPLIGFVYQYTLKGNPRNVHYGYRLFLGDRNFSKNGGFPSLVEIKNECIKEAKDVIENKLFDLK